MSRYIDADKLKEHYMWWGGGFTANCKDGQKEVKKIFDEIIDLQPTADVRENVRGEWKCNIEWGYGTCSVCGRTFPIRNGNPKADRYNFCPNCGADMRGGMKNEN